MLPGHFDRIEDFLREARPHQLLFLAAGTSGVVYPAAGLVHLARAHEADTWLLNAAPADNGSAFDHFIQGRSAELLPTLFDA
jgi:NAD-dependent deacetylase